MKATQETAPQSVQNGFSLISNEKLVEIFASMLKCRMIEERMRGPRKRATLRPEAVVAGVAIDLLPEDTLAASPRELAACFLKGVPLEALPLKILPRPRGPSPQNADLYSAHHVLAPWLKASMRLNVAAGAALAGKLSGRIAVAFGNAGRADAAWRETLEFASVHRLPMIFVRLGEARQPARKHRKRAARSKTPHALPTIPVDIDDAVAVYRVAQEAITHARRGNGPTLIECVPFRVAGASGARSSPDPVVDPILNMERYLDRKGLPVERLKQAVIAGFSRELGQAAKAAKRQW